jgi:hypothetical protein
MKNALCLGGSIEEINLVCQGGLGPNISDRSLVRGL